MILALRPIIIIVILVMKVKSLLYHELKLARCSIYGLHLAELTKHLNSMIRIERIELLFFKYIHNTYILRFACILFITFTPLLLFPTLTQFFCLMFFFAANRAAFFGTKLPLKRFIKTYTVNEPETNDKFLNYVPHIIHLLI